MLYSVFLKLLLVGEYKVLIVRTHRQTDRHNEPPALTGLLMCMGR